MSRKPPHLSIVDTLDAPTEGQLSELEAAVRRMERHQHLIIEFNREQAKILRSEFNEYVVAGFTEAQAMELVKAKLTPPAK